MGMPSCRNALCDKNRPSWLEGVLFPSRRGMLTPSGWFCSASCHSLFLINRTVEMHRSREYRMESRMKLGMILVDRRLIDTEELKSALDEQKRTSRRLGEILLSQGLLQEKDLLAALSRQYGISYIDFEGTHPPELPSPEKTPVPKELIVEFCLLPLEFNIKEHSLSLLLSDPSDLRLLIGFFNEFLPAFRVQYCLTTKREIEQRIALFYPDLQGGIRLPQEMEGKEEMEEMLLDLLGFLKKKREVNNLSLTFLDEALWLKFRWGETGCDFYFLPPRKERVEPGKEPPLDHKPL